MKVTVKNVLLGIFAGIAIFTTATTLELLEDRKVLEAEANSYIDKLYKIDGQIERGELLPVNEIYNCYPERIDEVKTERDVCIVDAAFDY